jgi:hypothetical protein
VSGDMYIIMLPCSFVMHAHQHYPVSFAPVTRPPPPGRALARPSPRRLGG